MLIRSLQYYSMLMFKSFESRNFLMNLWKNIPHPWASLWPNSCKNWWTVLYLPELGLHTAVITSLSNFMWHCHTLFMFSLWFILLKTVGCQLWQVFLSSFSRYPKIEKKSYLRFINIWRLGQINSVVGAFVAYQ